MQESILTLLLMAGLPGAGKTTLSQELGRDLGWYVQFKVILSVAEHDLRNCCLGNGPTQITAIHVYPETNADYLQYFKHLLPEPHRLIIYTNRPLQRCVEEAKDLLEH